VKTTTFSVYGPELGVCMILGLSWWGSWSFCFIPGFGFPRFPRTLGVKDFFFLSSCGGCFWSRPQFSCASSSFVLTCPRPHVSHPPKEGPGCDPLGTRGLSSFVPPGCILKKLIVIHQFGLSRCSPPLIFPYVLHSHFGICTGLTLYLAPLPGLHAQVALCLPDWIVGFQTFDAGFCRRKFYLFSFLLPAVVSFWWNQHPS